MRHTVWRGLAALWAILTLAAGSAAGPQMVSSQTYTKKAPYTIGYDNYFMGNSWSVQFFEEFKNAVSTHRALIKDVYYTDSGGQAARQVSNLENLKPSLYRSPITSELNLGTVASNLNAAHRPFACKFHWRELA